MFESVKGFTKMTLMWWTRRINSRWKFHEHLFVQIVVKKDVIDVQLGNAFFPKGGGITSQVLLDFSASSSFAIAVCQLG